VPTPPLSEETLIETVNAYQANEANQRAASEALGISRSALQDRLRMAKARGMIHEAPAPEVPQAAPLPDPDLPIEQLVTYKKSAFERKHATVLAKRWRRFNVPTHGPYALMFVGDPHLDDDGCNLPLWEDHCELMAGTEHLYAVNIGDTTNNWAGRLARLWANQDTSAHTAKRLVKHYLAERGIPWFLWLHGNHDMWDGPVGRDVFERHSPEYVVMEDWQAKITLASPNGREIRLWAAHNFKGNSIWNNMHGLERAAQMQDWAHLYVAGHHHDSGYRQGENPHRGFVYNLLRVRGYKFIDEYADVHGFGNHAYGASGVAVIDPDGDKLNAVTCFLDPHEGADFLAWKRRKAAA
jgi:hypothetical protein